MTNYFNKALINIAWSVLLIIAFITSSAHAQQLQIRASHSGKAVSNVLVYNTSQKVSAVSNVKGIVSIDSFSMKDTLIFQHASFSDALYTKQELKSLGYVLPLQHQSVDIEPFVLIANKSKEFAKDIPYRIKTIDAATIENTNAQTTADLLQARGGITVQKSQMGGGSPIIRGFEANRVLLVIDGVRMNNAIYRSGHLQNVISIDNGILDRLEVQFGPGSVIYGSDALGGVMHFYTRDPLLSIGDSNRFNARAYSRYSSANNERTGHIDFNVGFEKIAFLSSITTSAFDDLETGNIRHSDYPDFGKLTHYPGRIEGADTMLVNSNQDLQRGTGYDQLDILQKVLYQPRKNLQLLLNTQYSTSSDIPRFDRLNDFEDGILRYSDWRYGPQNRFLTSMGVDWSRSTKLTDNVRAILAYQDVDESRINRRFGRENRTVREENVKVYSFNLDAEKRLDTNQKVLYGLEVFHNDVSSSAFQESITTGEKGIASTRYADGGSIMQGAAAYLSYQRDLSSKLKLLAGVRYSHINLESTFKDTSFFQLPFDKIEFNTGALTGSIGLAFNPNKQWKVGTVFASGFRAPNVDDVGKVFDVDEFVVVPNEELKPEYAYNGEVNVTRWIGDGVMEISGSAYYSLITNIIVRKNYTLNGSDSLVYDGDLLRVQTNRNSNLGQIFGGTVSWIMHLGEHLQFENSYTYTKGRDLTEDEPLSHIPPLFGQVRARYESKRFTTGANAMFNGWKRIKDYGSGSTDRASEATVDGTPAWYIINWTNTLSVSDKFQTQFSIENIFDRHYKTFSSGVSGPGRNFRLSLRVKI